MSVTITRQRRDKLASEGKAMPDGSYPIANKSDLRRAIQAIGRAGDDMDATREFIIKRAKELNAVDMLPEKWINN